MIYVVVDNTVLSNFANVRQSLLLSKAFDQPVTVAAVREEFATGVALGRIPDVDWSWLQVVELTAEESAVAEKLNETLGRGEATCIALAVSRGWMVLTDDRDARHVAREMGAIVSGTLGALMNLVRGEILSLTEADQYLAAMKSSGYRSPVDSLSELDGLAT